MRLLLVVLAVMGFSQAAEARVYRPGERVKTLMNAWGTARIAETSVQGTVMLPQDFVAEVIDHQVRAGASIYHLKSEMEDPEHICSPEGKVEITIQMDDSHLISYVTTAQHEREMDKFYSDLQRLAPHLDFSAIRNRQKIITVLPWLGEVRSGEYRDLLIQACGDPQKIEEEDRKTHEELGNELDIRSHRLEELSAEYPLLSELKELLSPISFSDSRAYQEFLKNLPKKLKSGDEMAENFGKARALVGDLLLTSEILRPAPPIRRLLQETYSHPIARQIILEEAAYWFSMKDCARLVSSLNFLEHFDEDFNGFGLERENSTLFLYFIFHGAYFLNHECSKEITEAFGSFRTGLPYGLPLLINPASGHQRTLTKTFLFIPYKTEKLHVDEWGADVPYLGRIVMKETHYLWKTLDAGGKDAIKDSRRLIKEWAKRHDLSRP